MLALPATHSMCHVLQFHLIRVSEFLTCPFVQVSGVLAFGSPRTLPGRSPLTGYSVSSAMYSKYLSLPFRNPTSLPLDSLMPPLRMKPASGCTRADVQRLPRAPNRLKTRRSWQLVLHQRVPGIPFSWSNYVAGEQIIAMRRTLLDRYLNGGMLIATPTSLKAI